MNIRGVRELAEAGFTVEKIARIVYGDAHPMCVELVNIDLSEIKYRDDRGAIALFFDDVARHQKNLEDGAWLRKIHPLISLEDIEVVEDDEELTELAPMACEFGECNDCGYCC